MPNRMSSVFMGRDNQLIAEMFAFYAPAASVIRDVTANARKMWKGVKIAGDLKFYDIDQSVHPDVVCGWDSLPDATGTVDVLVYDPPHLPLAAASEKSISCYKRDYGLRQSVDADNIESLHPSFLKEARRVLKPDGLVFAKIKDYIHNHRYQWNLSEFTKLSSAEGLTPCDLIVKVDPCGGNLKSGRWQKTHHARNSHCYWVVLRNGKCEPKRVAV